MYEQLSSLLISYVIGDGEAELVEERNTMVRGPREEKVKRWLEETVATKRNKSGLKKVLLKNAGCPGRR